MPGVKLLYHLPWYITKETCLSLIAVFRVMLPRRALQRLLSLFLTVAGSVVQRASTSISVTEGLYDLENHNMYLSGTHFLVR